MAHWRVLRDAACTKKQIREICNVKLRSPNPSNIQIIQVGEAHQQFASFPYSENAPIIWPKMSGNRKTIFTRKQRSNEKSTWIARIRDQFQTMAPFLTPLYSHCTN